MKVMVFKSAPPAPEAAPSSTQMPLDGEPGAEVTNTPTADRVRCGHGPFQGLHLSCFFSSRVIGIFCKNSNAVVVLVAKSVSFFSEIFPHVDR